MDPFFLFAIEGRRFALELRYVDRVVPAAAVTPLSDGPDLVLGVLDLHGELLPVVDLRKRLRLPERQVRLDDSIVIARTPRRALAFFADTLEGVVEGSEGSLTPADEVVPGLEFVQGVMQVGDGLALIHDLDRLLSLEDQQRLDRALGGATDAG
jgi:purine-binding chemotaxis protein CheW